MMISFCYVGEIISFQWTQKLFLSFPSTSFAMQKRVKASLDALSHTFLGRLRSDPEGENIVITAFKTKEYIFFI